MLFLEHYGISVHLFFISIVKSLFKYNVNIEKDTNYGIELNKFSQNGYAPVTSTQVMNWYFSFSLEVPPMPSSRHRSPLRVTSILTLKGIDEFGLFKNIFYKGNHTVFPFL